MEAPLAEGLSDDFAEQSTLTLFNTASVLGEAREHRSLVSKEELDRGLKLLIETFIEKNPKPSTRFFVSLFWSALVHFDIQMNQKINDYFFTNLERNIERFRLIDIVQLFYALYKVEKNKLQAKNKVNLNIYFKNFIQLLLVNEGKLSPKEKSMVKEAAQGISYKGANMEKLMS